MAVTREMWDACQKIARAHPGVKLDVQNSTTNAALLIDPQKQRNWVVNRKGEIRRVVVLQK